VYAIATAKNKIVKTIIRRSISESSTAPNLKTAHQNFTMTANLRAASLFLRSGQKPVPATQVKPGVGDNNGPVTNNVPGTTEPALGPGITLGAVLTPEVIPPRPEKYGTFAWRYPYSVRNVMYSLGIQSKVSEVSQAL
jgi:hypothetical protein